MLGPDDAESDLESALAAFRRDGFARLGRVAGDAALAALGARADDLMLGRVRWPGMFFQHDAATGRYDDLPRGEGWVGPSTSYRKLEKLELDPIFRAWIENPLFERIAGLVLGPEITLYRAVLFVKPAGSPTPLPWHQDAGKMWGLDRDPELQLWTALDDAPPEAGCLEVVPGSHARGLATPLGGVVPESQLAADGALEGRVVVPARAGEVVLLHNLLWHCSSGNTTPRPRRALTVCFLPASTRCTRTRRAPRVFPRMFG